MCILPNFGREKRARAGRVHKPLGHVKARLSVNALAIGFKG